MSKINVKKIGILSRTQTKVDMLIDKYKNFTTLCNYEENLKYDFIINTTPMSLNDEKIDFPINIFNTSSISYDLFYSKTKTKFQLWSKDNGADKAYDGLGMLIQQAALSYDIWNNFKPNTKEIASKLGF